MTLVEGLATRVVRIAATTDRLTVVAEDRDDIDVQGDAASQIDGDELTLNANGRLVVRVPR